jgi:salicylate hydroxylase
MSQPKDGAPYRRALVAGGGIGGLAAALACGRAGWQVQLFERAPAFGEVGAGIQIGPNVTRVLAHWGLSEALSQVAAFPTHLQVRSARSGDELAVLPLGAEAVARYGAPYATIHRADLHQLLLQAVQAQGSAQLHLDTALGSFTQNQAEVRVQTPQGASHAADLLIGADGLWSAVRQWLLDDGMPRVTGHLAYRAMVPQATLPERLRSQHVTVWMGPRLHLVQYPVRQGQWLNVVGILQAGLPVQPDGQPLQAEGWDLNADAASLQAALTGAAGPLQELVRAIAHWRMWVLCDRTPMVHARQHARGRVALLGDAAHPMRPYLAQGAGMAIEDAAELGSLLAGAQDDLPVQLHRFAERRWQRNRRVQERAIRNGRIFHAEGLVQWGRDRALQLLGRRLIDVPWLYGYGLPPTPN